MSNSTLQFPNLFIPASTADDAEEEVAVIPTNDRTTTTSPSSREETALPHLLQQQQREFVDQTIIPHRLQIGLGIHQGAHGSLYKCHTLYLEYKSLRQQLLLQREEEHVRTDRNDETTTATNELRQRLQRTQRQLWTELQLQQIEFQKFIFLQPPQKTQPHEEDTASSLLLLSLLPSLRQRFHQAQQLHSCYQEYNAITQVLYSTGSDKTTTNNNTSLPTTTTTTSSSSSNEALQTMYDALVRDKQTLQHQISIVQQQEMQLRKQQLHLLQQTIQDMKHMVPPPPVQQQNSKAMK